MDALRLVGSGGANRAMEAEVKRLGPRAVAGFKFPKPKRLDEQTLAYPFDPALARMAAHYLRTPSRAYWDLYRVTADRLEPLFDDLVGQVAADDRVWMADGRSLSVDVRKVDAFAAGPLQIRGTVKNAIIEGAKRRGLSMRMDPENPDVSFAVRGEEGGLRISIDLAGQSLHLRGWRLDDAEAALKETLAAQMLILARWDSRSEILIDPTAGGGTIPAEAALAAVGRRRWIEPRRPLVDRILGPPGDLPDLFPGTEPQIIASEVDAQSFAKMQANLQRAGLEGSVVAMQGDLKTLDLESIAATFGQAHERGLIIANPPYGVRMEADEGLYRALRDLVNRTGFRAAFLAGNPLLERVMRRPPRIKKPMYNGPLAANFLLYDPPDAGV